MKFSRNCLPVFVPGTRSSYRIASFLSRTFFRDFEGPLAWLSAKAHCLYRAVSLSSRALFFGFQRSFRRWPHRRKALYLCARGLSRIAPRNIKRCFTWPSSAKKSSAGCATCLPTLQLRMKLFAPTGANSGIMLP